MYNPDMRKTHIGIHLYDFSGSKCSRMERFTSTLVRANIYDECHIIFLRLKNQTKEIVPGQKVQIYEFGFKRLLPLGRLYKLLNLLRYYVKTLTHILRNRQFNLTITAHSLNVLPVAVLASLLPGTKLIYAPHELETERGGQSRLIRNIRIFEEQLLIGQCNQIILVNETIADWYKNKYRNVKRIDFVYNYAEYPHGLFPKNVNLLRQKLQINSEKIILVTHGIITKGRGLISLMEAFTELPAHQFHLLIIGEGPLKSQLESYSLDNVTFWPFLEVSELLETIHDADIGLVLMEKELGLSYEYSSPNKLFECLASGVFIIATDLPEIRNFLLNDSNSILIPNSRKANIFDAVNQALELIKNGSIKSVPRRNFHWESQASKLVNIYTQITTSNPPTV